MVGSLMYFDEMFGLVEEIKCKNCQERLIRIRMDGVSQWYHLPDKNDIDQGAHKYCYITVGEPEVQGDGRMWDSVINEWVK